MIIRVSPQNLPQPLIDRHLSPIRAGGQVRERHHIQQLLLRRLEHRKLGAEAPTRRLELGAGVVGHQRHQQFRRSTRPEKPGTVERMKARLHQRGRVPDIMQPRRAPHHVSISTQTEPAHHLIRARPDPLNVQPARTQLAQQRLSQHSRTRHRVPCGNAHLAIMRRRVRQPGIALSVRELAHPAGAIVRLSCTH